MSSYRKTMSEAYKSIYLTKNDTLKPIKEEVELDEGTSQVLAHGGKGQYKVTSGGGVTTVKFKGKVVSSGDFDQGADGWFMNIKGEKGQRFFDTAQGMADYFAKNKITEDLDEGTWHIAKNLNALKKRIQKPMPKNDINVKLVMKMIGDDDLMDAIYDAKQGTDMVPMIKSAMKRLNIAEEAVSMAQQAAIAISKKERGNKPKKEEVELDELKPPSRHVGKSQKNPDMFAVYDQKEKEVKLFKDKKDAEEFAAKNHDMLMGRESKKEEVKLDELMPPSRHVGKSEKNPDMFAVYDQKGKEVKLFKDEGDAKEYATKNHEALMGHDKPKKEEDELDEGKMNQLHQYIKDKKSAEEIAKLMKVDVKTIKTLMSSNEPFKEEAELDEGQLKDMLAQAGDIEYYAKRSGGIDKKDMMKAASLLKKGNKSGALNFVSKLDTSPREKILDLMGEEVEESYEFGTDEYTKHTKDVTPGQGKEIDEARPSARRDAMKAMGKRGKDSADDDDYVATADDRKAADKNIIMQLRKATNLGGKYEVTFKDKKKVKVKPEIAMAFIKKFEKMKPVDKAKLQDKVSKSYKDLLKGLKEEDTSMLGRIEKKLKEIKNG